jgi:hypothetical protein
MHALHPLLPNQASTKGASNHQLPYNTLPINTQIVFISSLDSNKQLRSAKMILKFASSALTLASVLRTVLVAPSTVRQIAKSVSFAKDPTDTDSMVAHLQTKGRNVLSTNCSKFKRPVVRRSIVWGILCPLLAGAASNSMLNTSKTLTRRLQLNHTAGLLHAILVTAVLLVLTLMAAQGSSVTVIMLVIVLILTK